MDNLHYASTHVMNDALVLRFDGKEEEELANPDDVLARRLKNRERQRRYRARKREQDNTRKALITANQLDSDDNLHHYHQHTTGAFVSVPLQIDDSLNVPSSIRVHSLRNWKRDARKANEDTKRESDDCSDFKAPLEGFVEADDNATKRIQLSRRHWKSDARNKKGLE